MKRKAKRTWAEKRRHRIRRRVCELSKNHHGWARCPQLIVDCTGLHKSQSWLFGNLLNDERECHKFFNLENEKLTSSQLPPSNSLLLVISW